MAAKSKEWMSIKKGERLLVVLLSMLLLFACVCALPSSYAYADEAPEVQAEGQQAPESSEEDSSYQVYTFDAQDVIDAQTNQSGTVIPDAEIPLSSSLHSSQSTIASNHGSIFNTIIAVLCAVSMLLMFLVLSIRKTSDYKVIAVRTIAAAFGLVTIATWSLLDMLQIPSLLFNDASGLLAALFCIYAVFAVYSYVYEARINKAKAQETQEAQEIQEPKEEQA